MPHYKKRRKELKEQGRQASPSPAARGRSSKWTTFAIVAAVVVVILAVVGIGYYQNYVAPFRRNVLKIDNLSINMNYFLKMTKLSGGDPLSTLPTLSNQLMIKLVAPGLGITVTKEEVDKELNTRASGSDNTTLSKAEFREWYRQQLNSTKLSDAEFKDIVMVSLLGDKVNTYLQSRVPTSADQVHVYDIMVKTYDEANQVRARWQKGEDFQKLAEDVSIDIPTRDSGGDMGWLPKGVRDQTFDDAVFKLAVGEVSEPVSSQEGFYLYTVTEKASNRQIDPDSLDTLRNKVMSTYLTAEMANHKVEYHFDSVTYAWVNLQLAKAGATPTNSQ